MRSRISQCFTIQQNAFKICEIAKWPYSKQQLTETYKIFFSPKKGVSEYVKISRKLTR